MVFGTSVKVSTRAVGEARLQFAVNKFLMLRDFYSILGFRRN